MSSTDLINILIISASRSFVDKLEDQKAYESAKNINRNFTKVPTQQISTNSHYFSQHRQT